MSLLAAALRRRLSAGGGGGHRYWRIFVPCTSTPYYGTIEEIELFLTTTAPAFGTDHAADQTNGLGASTDSVAGTSGTYGNATSRAVADDGGANFFYTETALSGGGWWWSIDLGSAKAIKSANFLKFGHYVGSATAEIQWSDDNSTWTTAATLSIGTPADYTVNNIP